MALHKESARNSEEVRGVRGIVQELQNLHESSSPERKFAYLLAKWLISYEDDITEKPQSDNKTARKSLDPADMNKFEQHLRVTSAYNPVLSRELDELQLLEAASQEVAIDSQLKFKKSRGCTLYVWRFLSQR